MTVDQAIFFYGSLRDEELLARLVGSRPLRVRPARLTDAVAVRVPGEDYPMLADRPDCAADGVLVDGLDAVAWERIVAYEIGEYALTPVRVDLLDPPGGPEDALCFRPGAEFVARLNGGAGDVWDLDAWRAAHKPAALAAVDAAAPWFDAIGPEETMRLWADLLGRAPDYPSGALGLGPGAPGVTVDRVDTLARNYLAVEKLTVSHASFRGDRVGPIEREVVRLGSAVTVIPYDPVADLVALIEQFRAGPLAAGDPQPWLIEAPAGGVEPGEDPETAARRETAEETGLAIGRLEAVGDYYPAAGNVDQRVYSYIGEAQLAALASEGDGSVAGLAEEGEDIRRLIVPLETALIAAAKGEIRNGPALLSLYWLDRHKTRLAALWRDPPDMPG